MINCALHRIPTSPNVADGDRRTSDRPVRREIHVHATAAGDARVRIISARPEVCGAAITIGNSYDSKKEELQAKVSNFLAQPADRQRISQSMLKTVLDRFTYEKTSQRLLRNARGGSGADCPSTGHGPSSGERTLVLKRYRGSCPERRRTRRSRRTYPGLGALFESRMAWNSLASSRTAGISTIIRINRRALTLQLYPSTPASTPSAVRMIAITPRG